MSLLCASSDPTHISNIPLQCLPTFGQVQKGILQRVFLDGNTKNTIADPTVIASWTPLLAAGDGSKVVQTPYIQAPASEPGAQRTFGGGNETLNGIEIIKGVEPTTFTGSFYESSQAAIKEMKKYSTESSVGIWLVDENGNIGCLADDSASPTTYYPIPIYGLFVGDLSFGNYDGVNSNGISFKKAANWSDNFVVVSPTDFSALTDLITPPED